MKSLMRSEIGRARQDNEDSYSISDYGSTRIMVLADGIGGVNGGEVASQIAVKVFLDCIDKQLSDRIDTISEDELKEELTLYFQEANKAICLKAIEDPNLKDMGTTMTAVIIRGRQLIIAHMGDCRTYLIHGSSMTLLTSDHTFAAELCRKGTITREEMENHPGRNKLLKSLGENSFITPDFYVYNIIYGDMVLLCTDGVYSVLKDADILKCCKKHNDLESCLDNLFNSAYEAGTQDNVTVLLTHVTP